MKRMSHRQTIEYEENSKMKTCVIKSYSHKEQLMLHKKLKSYEERKIIKFFLINLKLNLIKLNMGIYVLDKRICLKFENNTHRPNTHNY